MQSTKSELEGNLASATSTLQASIDSVNGELQSNLASATSTLQASIDSVNSDLQSTKTDLQSTNTQLDSTKTELENSLATTRSQIEVGAPPGCTPQCARAAGRSRSDAQ